MLLRCQNVLLDGQWQACDIRVAEGKIVEISTDCSTNGEQILELRDLTLLPGLIDSHIHGYAGYDTMDGDEAALQAMSRALLQAGVTAFLPTTMTAFPKDLLPALSAVGKLTGQNSGGARILGAFAEGPFISEAHRGAQPLAAISPVDFDLLEQMDEASNHSLKKVIFAPEIEGADALCKKLLEKEIVPAMGHSSATYAEGQKAIDAGATVLVHSFNGMSGIHHREPAMLGAVMNRDEVYAELILDGIHVHPAAANLLLKAKGSDKVVLISDCMRAGGMADGEYMLGDTKTFVKDGIARTAEGNLAGSTLKLMDAVKNAVEFLHIPLEEAVKMAAENPAKELGVFDKMGSIAVGKYADLVAIDKDFKVKFAMVGGEVLFSE